MSAATSNDKNWDQDSKNGQTKASKQLILCFDGTGNTFQGNTGDTNIVKLLDMFERSSPNQMHYYQPGIGTYSDGPVNRNLVGRIKQSVSHTLDSGFATSFDAHVIAGYRFLMRYYNAGDRIYIFGFSRGAFTARFLARLVSHVGLLSMGNEEMVPFAYKVYQDYAMGEEGQKDSEEARYPEPNNSMENPSRPIDSLSNEPSRNASSKTEASESDSSNTRSASYMEAFREAFCRHQGKEKGIEIQFLGLFDTVSSVRAFDVPFGKTIQAPVVHGTAKFIRHAVAIDERRVKFKAALLSQEMPTKGENVKEVWFPGNHGDIGGGWLAQTEDEPKMPESFFKRLEKSLKSERKIRPHVERNNDKFQLSDIALKWMIDELEYADRKPDENGIKKTRGIKPTPETYLDWNKNKGDFLRRFKLAREDNKIINAYMHDTMRLGRGSSLWKTIMWNVMEWLPIIRRWEYFGDKNPAKPWEYVYWPLNKGETRDIPKEALFHESVIDRMGKFEAYRPSNDVKIDDCSTTQLRNVLESNVSIRNPGPFKACGASNDREDKDIIYKLKHVHLKKDDNAATGKNRGWFLSAWCASFALLISSVFAYRRL